MVRALLERGELTLQETWKDRVRHSPTVLSISDNRAQFAVLWTPLELALFMKAALAVDALLERAKVRDCNVARKGMTPLTFALCHQCPPEMIASLLLAGADPALVTEMGSAEEFARTFHRGKLWSDALQSVRQTRCRKAVLVLLGCRRHRTTPLSTNHADVIGLVCKALWALRGDLVWDRCSSAR